MCLFMPVHCFSRTDAAMLVATAGLLISMPAASARAATPNDPGFSLQWGDENTGQGVPLQQLPYENLRGAVSGNPGADDAALQAWGSTTGSPSIVIGEVDTGIDYTHPDVAANVWTNPGGVGSCHPPAKGCEVASVEPLTGRCEAGTRGYNTITEACEPMDEEAADLEPPHEEYGGHGTHVAGIMGALGNNGVGVTGMNWQTSILPVKWLDKASQLAETKYLIAALRWLRDAKRSGVKLRIVNDSAVFKGTSKSKELQQVIEELGEEGIIFVTAAGNEGVNENEETGRRYPCAFHLANEICVTATNDRDELAGSPVWASYGSGIVQLAAPGASIYSTLREGKYGYLSGTSMAAAQVSGAAALILSAQPGLSATQLKEDILEHADKVPALEGKVEGARRLNVCAAIPGCQDLATSPSAQPPPGTKPSGVGTTSATGAAAPVISGLAFSPRAFLAARSGPAIQPLLVHAGATVSYTDTQPALVQFTVLAPASGVRNAANRCVAPPLHSHGYRRLKRCTRRVAVGRFVRIDRTGSNGFRFSGRIPGARNLAAGSYLLRAVPALEGREGAPVTAAFRVLAPRRTTKH